MWTLLGVSSPNFSQESESCTLDANSQELRGGGILGDGSAKRAPKVFRDQSHVWPIIAGMPLSLGLILFVLNQAPGIVVLSLVPGVLVIGTFLWLGQIEPGTRQSQLYAVMWGATTAVTAAVVCNSLFYHFFGEAAGVVVAAPVVEEVVKLLGVWWVMRNCGDRTALLGSIHAGLVAGGFALVENIQYFYQAYEDGLLAWTFIGRGVLTPFMHPLFTIPAAITLASGIGSGTLFKLWGLPVSVALHAWWNGSIVLLGRGSGGAVPVWTFFVGGAYVGAFLTTVVGFLVARERAKKLYPRWVGKLAFEQGLTPHECGFFSTWGNSQTARRRLSRKQRRSYDDLHSAVVALMRHHAGARVGNLGSLVDDLEVARRSVRY